MTAPEPLAGGLDRSHFDRFGRYFGETWVLPLEGAGATGLWTEAVVTALHLLPDAAGDLAVDTMILALPMAATSPDGPPSRVPLYDISHVQCGSTDVVFAVEGQATFDVLALQAPNSATILFFDGGNGLAPPSARDLCQAAPHFDEFDTGYLMVSRLVLERRSLGDP